MTLSAPRFGTKISKEGIITAPMDKFWEGPAPPWCTQIIEVLSHEPWYKVPDEEKTLTWRRE